MKTAVVKYNAGNVRSVLCALGRLGCDASVTDDPSELRSADRVIFPGVGEASTAMEYLKAKHLDDVLVSLKRPFLGICLGLQLMCRFSEEHDTPCLGIFDADVRRFPPQTGDKIPHVGWNTVSLADDPLFAGLPSPLWCYFVHSYYVPRCSWTVGASEYAATPFSASLHKDNFWGCQFHPEKSGRVGEAILKNFLEIE
jgi:glutamine amidotransferase